ncbi:GNAT family N-acetyltransferase [Alkalihalobacillus sp. AL-G]|uniref:GNAT family N-acetyltransferase n=1 Tax=Alkalihalobacillus sp. AL-G TaxID=2926399 RepID=UPI00272A1616|nr:GNAT family N-acetyltransferase [Alkalihalobacillus sp. AL-G]WLD91942.1 GNAT family N-acetyltransferase [Alkalihalobacillus sp. AL-G]
MIEIKRLSECSLLDVLDSWNNGFKGYFSPMTMTVDQFLKRMVQEGLSAEDSIIAYVDGVPAGIILNGFRTVDEEVVSYNGGTGVAPEFRRTGVGRKMMEKVVDIYRKKDVSIATLEAIVENEAAINLYKSLGYLTDQNVAYLQQEGIMSSDPFQYSESNGFTSETTLPEMISHLPFYKTNSPWQTQWQSTMNGTAMIARKDDKEIGYAIYRNVYHPDGSLATIVLHQIGTVPEFDDQNGLVGYLLSAVLKPEVNCKRLVINSPLNEQPLMNQLGEAGFSTMVEQVWMKKAIKEPSKTNAKSIEKV